MIKECVNCNNKYKTNRYSQKFCTKKCREYYHTIKREKRRIIIPPKIDKCVRCGAEYSKKRYWQKYCSKQCQWKTAYQRNKEQQSRRKIVYYQENKRDILEKRKEYAKENKEKISLKNINYYQNNKRQYRNYNLIRYYGVSIEQYEEILKKQNYKCAICGKNRNGDEDHFSVDHCHKTNKIRGLLCSSCNLGLGNLRNNPFILYKSIEYLKVGDFYSKK